MFRKQHILVFDRRAKEKKSKMDDYPAGDPIPDPSVFDIQHNELVDFLSNSREMRQTAKSSFKQAAYAGGT